VDWHGNCAPVGMAHDVMATVYPRDNETSALEGFDDFRSRYGRDATRHKAASYQKSGNVECQSQLVRYPNLFNEKFKAGPQIVDRGVLRRPLAECRDARTQLGRRVPAAVLILLDDVWHMDDTSHSINYRTSLCISRCEFTL